MVFNNPAPSQEIVLFVLRVKNEQMVEATQLSSSEKTVLFVGDIPENGSHVKRVADSGPIN